MTTRTVTKTSIKVITRTQILLYGQLKPIEQILIQMDMLKVKLPQPDTVLILFNSDK